MCVFAHMVDPSAVHAVEEYTLDGVTVFHQSGWNGQRPYWAEPCIHMFASEVGWFLGTVTCSAENSWAKRSLS